MDFQPGANGSQEFGCRSGAGQAASLRTGWVFHPRRRARGRVAAERLPKKIVAHLAIVLPADPPEASCTRKASSAWTITSAIAFPMPTTSIEATVMREGGLTGGGRNIASRLSGKARSAGALGQVTKLMSDPTSAVLSRAGAETRRIAIGVTGHAAMWC